MLKSGILLLFGQPEVAVRLGIDTTIPPHIQQLYRQREHQGGTVRIPKPRVSGKSSAVAGDVDEEGFYEPSGPYKPPKSAYLEPEYPTKFPIDDTQLHKLMKEDPKFLKKTEKLPWEDEKVLPTDEERAAGERPPGRKPPTGSTMLPQSAIGDALFVWNFLNVFWCALGSLLEF